MNTAPFKGGGLTAVVALSAGIGAAMVAAHPQTDGTYMLRPLLWINPITSFAKGTLSEARAIRPALTANEIVTWMRDQGLPITAIADVTGVERKTVYAWLSGGAVKQQNQYRLERLYTLLSTNKSAELRNLYRFWNRQATDGKTFAELLREPQLNEPAVLSALNELWPLAKKQQSLASSSVAAERNLKVNPFVRDMRDAGFSYDS